MNKTKKLFLAVATIALIAPSIALAAWWNPLSWFNHWGMGVVDFPQTTVVEKKVVPVNPVSEKPVMAQNKEEAKTTPTPPTQTKPTVQSKTIPILPKTQSSQGDTYEKVSLVAKNCSRQGIEYHSEEYYNCFFPQVTLNDCENIKIIEDSSKKSREREKNLCFDRFAYSKSDVSICKKLQNDVEISLCITAAAKKLKDEKICDNQILDYNNQSIDHNKQFCIQIVRNALKP